jgi:hypothetical protein
MRSVNNLPPNAQAGVRSFFRKSSNSYRDFRVETSGNGNFMVRMTKPGNVPGSKAVYHKEIDVAGNTVGVFKRTYDPNGNLIHVKNK